MSMIPEAEGIIESAVEPLRNRRLYWLNTENKKMYILRNGQYELLEKETEIITNSNGTAMKFPDGTLICSNWIGMEANISNKTITFPYKFIDTAYRINIQNIYAYSKNIVYSVAGIMNESVSIYPSNATTGETPTVRLEFMYTAIGRWK